MSLKLKIYIIVENIPHAYQRKGWCIVVKNKCTVLQDILTQRPKARKGKNIYFLRLCELGVRQNLYPYLSNGGLVVIWILLKLLVLLYLNVWDRPQIVAVLIECPDGDRVALVIVYRAIVYDLGSLPPADVCVV